ncbi:hypothetical protein D3C77_706190 [compost metagenome]
MLAHDLAAHHAVETLLQVGNLVCHCLQPVIGDGTDLAVLQCNGIADMVLGSDGIQPKHVSRHPEVDHHAQPLGVVQAGLETTAMHGIERGQRIVGIEQR